MNIKKLQQETVSTLTNTPIRKNDYEWVYLENLFSEETYNQLLELDNQKLSEVMLEVFDNHEWIALLSQKFQNSPKRSDSIKSIYTFWQEAGAGYSLKPHEDSFPRVFTMTLYFPDNNDAPEAGTAIYRVNTHNKDYETIAVAPFLRNSGKIIAPYEGLTWHGVNLVEKDIRRRSVVVVFSAQEWNENQLHYSEWKPGRTVEYQV